MKNIIFLAIIFPLLGNAGSLRYKDAIEKVFKNKDCLKTDSCDLVKAKLWVQDYTITFPEFDDPSHATRMFAGIETKDLSTLKKYAYVQLIKGCHFTTTKKDDEIFYTSGRVRDYFMERLQYKHPEWTIDSWDFDPMYASYDDAVVGKDGPFPEVRFSYYFWNENPNRYDQATEHKLAEGLPPFPRIYTVDHPGTAFLSANNSATNISLEFKICLVKEKDIPRRVVDPTDTSWMKPIKCFDWSSSFIYDFEQKKYTSPKGIHPYCE
jgi:hypothetical protein